MRLLRIYNDDLGLDVQYKTDLITHTQDNFTVMEIIGLDDEEKVLGIDFQKISYNIPSIKAFCEQHGFGLSLQTIGSVSDEGVEELVAPQPGPSEE